jgi:hypothetical protein
MNTNKKRSFLAGIHSWGLAAITFVAAIILLFGLAAILGEAFKINENIGDSSAYILYDLFIAACCFFIIRQNPKSIWYVPIICNLAGITSAIVEPNFWITSLWMLICGGWVLSIITSIIGARVGRRAAVKGMNVPK